MRSLQAMLDKLHAQREGDSQMATTRKLGSDPLLRHHCSACADYGESCLLLPLDADDCSIYGSDVARPWIILSQYYVLGVIKYT